MLELHVLFKTMIISNLMFKNYVHLGWVVVHSIIQQHDCNCMDINPKIYSTLEGKTDMIFSVIWTHTKCRTLQQDLVMQEVLVSGI